MQTLVPGRECGTCNACCVALTINEPALQKAQGYRCRNLRPDKGCGIYDARPDTCREFNCGWRQLRWVKEGMRPDVSGVLVQLHQKVSEVHGDGRTGIVVTLLHRGALKAEGLAETMAAAVMADLPIILQIPGPPGHTYGRALMNDALFAPVRARDKEGMLKVLRQAYAAGRHGDHKPITFKPHPPATPGAMTPQVLPSQAGASVTAPSTFPGADPVPQTGPAAP